MSEFPLLTRAFAPGADLLLLSSGNAARSNAATGMTGFTEWNHDPSAGRISTRLGCYTNMSASSGMVAALTGATFTNATGVLSMPTAAFANYRWQPGDAFNCTGGTGVQQGFYEITSGINSTSIQLNTTQPLHAGTPTDVAGTLVRADNPADVVVPAGIISEGGQIVIETVGACGALVLADIGVAALELTDATFTGAAAGNPTATVAKTANFTSYTFTTGDHIAISNSSSVVGGSYPILSKTNDDVTIGGFGWAPAASVVGTLHAVNGKAVPIEFRLFCTALDGYSSPTDLLLSDAIANSNAGWRPNVVMGGGTCSFRMRYTISTVQAKSATSGQTTVSAELWHSMAPLSQNTNCSNNAMLYRSTMFRSNVDLRAGVRLMPMVRHYANTATFIGTFNTRNITAYATGPKLGLN